MAWILVVDDEPAVREVLIAQLETLRHRCVPAENGLAALERLSEREFDLVLTDVMMPHLNGFQFLERALPYIEGRTPVVILSSVDDQDGIQAALAAGAYDWLHKPARTSEVERVVDGALTRRAENVRLLGRHRGRRGPVPTKALGAREGEEADAPVGQPVAGVPALRGPSHVVQIPRPGGEGADAAAGGGLVGWIRRLLGRAA